METIFANNILIYYIVYNISFKCNNKSLSLFSGNFRKIVFPVIYSYILLSFFAMEVYLKYQAFLQHNSATNKSDIISLSVIFASQFILDFVLPSEWKGREYFIFKVFFNTLVCTILLPSLMILAFPNLKKYCRQFIASKLSVILRTIQSFRKICFSLTNANNQVSPDTGQSNC